MLKTKLAKSKMENEEGMNHLLVTIKPEESKSIDDKPVAFLLVIDNSGSMDMPADHQRNERSTKLDYVKNASEKLIDLMKNGDMLGVVSFSNIAQLEYPLTTLTKEEKFKMKDRIRAIRTLGATNISDGLDLAYKQIPNEIKESHHIKMILLSDGEANNGITNIDTLSSIVAGYRKNAVNISTIGVGLDYNSFFMENIATSAGGMFYHLKNMTDLEFILSNELKSLANLTTTSAIVSIQVSDGIILEKNLNGFSEELLGQIYLGNVFSEQDIVIEFGVKEKVKTKDAILTIRYEYKDGEGKEKAHEEKVSVPLVDEEEMENVKINQEVVNLVKELMEAKTKKESLRHFEAGNFNGMVRSFDAGKFASMSATYQIDLSDSVTEIQNLQNSLQMNKVSKKDVKEMYAASYKKSRNEKDSK
jgi:Ca-activated chloride channel family protein